jgi:branched-chain amino acid transport system substrate-binding protein
MLRRLVLLLAASLLVAIGCSPSGQSPPGTIVLGAIYPLTGPQAPGGREELNGLQTALQVAQERSVPGAARVQLHVISVTTPDEARAAVDRLIDRYHVPAIIGTYGSTLADVAAARADQRHVVYWETGAVADSITVSRRYVFRTVATGSTLGLAAADFTSGTLLPASGMAPSDARVVIVAVNDVYGRSVADAEASRAAEHGIRVADRIDYDPHLVDPNAIAQRLADDRADYLWDVSYIDDGIAIWQSVLAHGIRLQAAVGTSSAFCMPQFGQRLGAQAVGLYAADKPDGSAVPPAVLLPATRDLRTAAAASYQQRSGGEKMSIPAVAGFVGGWALFHGVLPTVRGALTSDALRTAAYALDEPRFSSINGGGVQFAPPGAPDAGQNLLAPAVVGQWQSLNTMHTVYPNPFAEAKPVLRVPASAGPA